MWRCVKRLDYGKKYCHNSPTLEENRIQAAIVNVIQKFAQQDPQLLKTLKSHIERGIKDPQLTTVFKLSEALGIKPWEFVKKVEENLPDGLSLIDN